MSSSGIQQIQVKPLTLEDRMLLRISMTNQTELSCYLTRNFVKNIAPALLKMLKTDPKIQKQQSITHKQAHIAFEHERIMQSSGKASPFIEKDQPQNLLGEENNIISNLKIRKTEDNNFDLNFSLPSGVNFSIPGNKEFIHVFYQLLASAASKLNWDLAFENLSATATNQPKSKH